MKRERVGGVNAVAALIEHGPERLVQIWVRETGGRLADLVARAGSVGLSVQVAGDRALDKLAQGEHHQGVVAEFLAAEPLGESELEERIRQAGRAALVLVLDQVQDPHNLGACLRSAAAAGACAVTIPRDRSAGLTPAARRAAAGAAEIVPLAAVANLARSLERMADAGLWRVGLAGDAEQSLYAADLEGPLALVVGSEEKGLRRLTREHCDELARIPLTGPVESLNVSVAAGIALFEARRRRLAAGT